MAKDVIIDRAEEEGIISTDEASDQKDSLEEKPKKSEQFGQESKEGKKEESSNENSSDESSSEEKSKSEKTSEESDSDKDPSISSEKTLIIFVGVLLVLFGSFFVYSVFFGTEPLPTIEELHLQNTQGELDDENAFLYNDVYSFIKIDDVWHTQLSSPTGNTLYSLSFRFSPLEVEDYPIVGAFNISRFNNADTYFVTFNPLEKNHSPTALAVADFNQHMMQAFQKTPIAACDRNATQACAGRPIVTCDSTDDIVVYIEESDQSRVEYKNNCIHVKGQGLDLVRGVDKALYTMYKVFPS